MPTPQPADEADRLAALRRCLLLDTLPEQAFDDITRLASQICGTPISTITLIDRDRQWFKSKVGVDSQEDPREHSFCAHAILEEDLLVVPDATQDERFAANPLVMGGPRIRFYAGAPFRVLGGHAVGSLCVIDRQPRVLTAEQQESLRALCRQVAAQVELKRLVAELRREVAERQEVEAALRESKQRFRIFMDKSPAIAYIKDEAGRYIYVNELCAQRFGIPKQDWLGRTDTELWAEEIAQPLRERDLSVLNNGALLIEEEIPTPDGLTQCWLSHKFPLRRTDGRLELAGLSLDITARKRAEREREALVGELREALAQVTTLKGLLPICSTCKNIRDDAGYWQQIDAYLAEHSELEFTHGICPDCMEKLYPESAKILREEPGRYGKKKPQS